MKNIDKKELHSIFTNLRIDKEKSFNELYEKYSKLIYNIAFSILKSRENSEDVMQNVFSKIYKLDNEKLPSDNEASWLYSITKNETINYMKKLKKEVSIEDIDYVQYDDKDLENIIDKDSYEKIMDKLDKTEKEIVSLKIIGNMKFMDIAQLLDMPMGTVQWKYYTALHSLKIILGNLSMVLVGFILFVANRMWNGKMQENSAGVDMSVEEVQNKPGDSSNTDMEVQNIINSSGDTTSSIENETDNINDINDYTNQADANQNELVNVPDETYTENWVGTTILSITTIFIIFTIIFTIIYIKHQQKSKKKLSK